MAVQPARRRRKSFSAGGNKYRKSLRLKRHSFKASSVFGRGTSGSWRGAPGTKGLFSPFPLCSLEVPLHVAVPTVPVRRE